jgi:Clr5 domain
MARSATCLPRYEVPTHPSSEDWAQFKELIVQLYFHDDKSLAEVQGYLKDTFNFDAT